MVQQGSHSRLADRDQAQSIPAGGALNPNRTTGYQQGRAYRTRSVDGEAPAAGTRSDSDPQPLQSGTTTVRSADPVSRFSKPFSISERGMVWVTIESRSRLPAR